MNTNQFAHYNLRIPSFKCTLILSFCITLSLANATNLKGFFLPAPSIGPGETCEAVNCEAGFFQTIDNCLLYTSPSPRDQRGSRMPSSA